MAVYDYSDSDLYGYNHLGRISDPIEYLLFKAQIANNASVASDVAKNVVDSSNTLDKEIKGKYNILKEQEPQSAEGYGFKMPTYRKPAPSYNEFNKKKQFHLSR